MADLYRFFNIDPDRFFISDDTLETNPRASGFLRPKWYRYPDSYMEDIQRYREEYGDEHIEFSKPSDGWFFIEDDEDFSKAFGVNYDPKIYPRAIKGRIEESNNMVIEAIMEDDRVTSKSTKVEDIPGYIGHEVDPVSGTYVYKFNRGFNLIPLYRPIKGINT